MKTDIQIQAQALLDEANTAIRKAKLNLILNNRVFFFSALLANLKQRLDETHETAATDGIHIWLNPHWILTMTSPQLSGLLMHEALHVAFEHIVWAKMQHLDRRIHNMACDYYINLHLTKLGFQLPPKGLMEYKYNGMSSMEIYHELMQDPPPDEPIDLVHCNCKW